MISSTKAILKRNFPWAWNLARATGKLLRLIPRIYGYERRTCVLCGFRGNFLAEIHFPDIFTYDAICPRCGSMPRNRLLKLAVESKRQINKESRVLHFAPESTVRTYIEPRVALYRTTDLYAAGVDLKLDIEAIEQPSASWDVIICSHVLEHVDHHKALKELHRILSPGGRLLALFPIVEGWADHYEDMNIQGERDRGLHFGKENHVRRFGAAVRDDIRAAGFELDCFAPIGAMVVEFGLIPGETLFIAKVP